MILSPRGKLREDRWRGEKTLQLPYTECMRCDIIEANWECSDFPHELQNALRRFDPAFEIIFDPLCREPGTYGPAFFLYKKTIDRNGPMDALKLELPIQRDCDYVWPEGGAAVPGMWFLDEWKRRDKSRLPGTPWEVEKELMRRKFEAAAAREAARQAEANEPFFALDDELGPYIQNGRCGGSVAPMKNYRPAPEHRPGKKIVGTFR